MSDNTEAALIIIASVIFTTGSISLGFILGNNTTVAVSNKATYANQVCIIDMENRESLAVKMELMQCLEAQRAYETLHPPDRG